MRWNTTGILLLSAAVLFGCIYFFERRFPASDEPKPMAPRLIPINPEAVTAIQLRRTNQFILRAERTNQNWNITAPISYRADGYPVERLLASLAAVTSYTYISPEELKAGHKTLAEFGLDVPIATVTLHHDGRRTELLFGEASPAGDLAYFQLLDTPGIYLVPAELARQLPHTVNQWRDTALVNLEGINADRFEVRSPSRGFAIQTTNGQFQLTRPSPAKADRARVVAILQKLQQDPVLAFVSDNPRGELDEFGLQPPVAEVVFGVGTNDAVVVQFGKSPSNDVVYARRLLNNNVVLVSRSVLEAVQVPAIELRDRHLLSFRPDAVDTIEVFADENFTIRRQGTNTWTVLGSEPSVADVDLVRECLSVFSILEGDVEKDAVTDFSAYGLAPPIRQYLLTFAGTNTTESATNRLLTHLDIGGRRSEKFFARGPESTVYTVDSKFIDRLPAAAWQLRDRRVWSFATNQVTHLAVRHHGENRRLVRGSNGHWKFDEDSVGMVNTFAIEEGVFRLSELRAVVWMDRGEGKRQLYGFRENGDKLIIELRNGERTQVLSLEFGGPAASGYPYALAVVDGQSWIFEFPLREYIQVVQPLLNQLIPSPAAKAPPL